MFTSTFYPWLNALQQLLIAKNQRQLIVLNGQENWSLSLLESIGFKANLDSKNKYCAKKTDTWLFYTDNQPRRYASTLSSPTWVNKHNYRHKLGSESHFVVFSIDDFNIDAFAALSGTLVAGGILFLLVPQHLNVNDSSALPSIFMKRFFAQLKLYQGAVFIEQIQHVFPQTPQEVTDNELLKKQTPKIDYSCATNDQLQAVNAVVKVATRHRNRPLILTADRGRGKSSALAIACQQLLIKSQSGKGEKQYIIITAPHIKALDVFFMRLMQRFPQAKCHGGKFIDEHGIIEFLPLDQIVKHRPKTSLLLVDEAAALPVYLLTALLSSYHRLVFSSTVHGYEGAGRGFTLKFQQTLLEKHPELVKLHLNQPIRWQENDPLEQFVYQACLLNASLDEQGLTNNIIDHHALVFSVLSAEYLLKNEAVLQQVFSVLVTAHYQTKPSDLQLMLDNSHVRIVALTYHNKIVAVALLLHEGREISTGALPIEDVDLVKKAQRRLRDQFLPQSLLTHCGIEQAFDFSYLRVMRIAVHPLIQQQGIGSILLEHIEQYASKKKVDFIGSSFGANAQLLQFWFKAEFSLMRVGFAQDSASGEHSALVLKTINKQKNAEQQALFTTTHKQFYQSFDYLLTDEYKQLSDKLVWLIIANMPKEYLPALTNFDKKSVRAFANKERLYSTCVYSLHQWLLHQLNQGYFNDKPDVLIIIYRLLKKHSIAQTCHFYDVAGKKSFNQLLLNFVDDSLNEH